MINMATISGLQATDGPVVDHLQVHLVSHQLSDVVDAVFDHGGSEIEKQLLLRTPPPQQRPECRSISESER